MKPMTDGRSHFDTALRSGGWLGLIALLAIGCGGQYESSATGTVAYDGTPLDRGTVAFYPKGGGAAAYGSIQPDGTFELRTGDGRGLAAGDYQVTVQSVERIQAKSENNPPTAKTLIPLKYKDETSSGLTYTVERGRNQFEIVLPAVK